MPFAAALSTAADTRRALADACRVAREHFTGEPDLALVFYTPHHAEQADALAAASAEALAPARVLGCCAEWVLGADREVEEGPGLTVWLGGWPGAVLEAFALQAERTPDGFSILGQPDALVAGDCAGSTMLLIGDPYTFPVDSFLRRLNENCPGLPVIGGMASGARRPGGTQLLYHGEVRGSGAVGVLLPPAVRLRSVVSQGCRPIGRHLVITKAEENLIYELGGRPPIQQLRELFNSLSEHDQELFQRGLHLGRAITEYRDVFQRGDFLVRNVVGLHQATGALEITDRVRVGQTVQFHVRDAASADEDLHALLQLDQAAAERRPAAALLFSCNGRGTRLFDEPDHDARVVRNEAGAVPLAGFFAAGELGPVGGQNFIHGFTASVVVFEEG